MRLFNAHRRVLFKRPLPIKEIKALTQQPDGWRKLLTDDVVEFVDKLEESNLAGSPQQQQQRIRRLLHSPAAYFGWPQNVPLEMRKQVYLPTFSVTLLRTSHLPPKYASFIVPLWFNKLDFKNYLKNVYNVDVIHIRSYVEQMRVKRQERRSILGFDKGNGRLYRPPSIKRMTVELVDPFVYPEEVEDLSPWEADTYKQELKEYGEMSKEMSKQLGAVPPIEADKTARSSIAQQAQDYLKGKQKWKPTWQSIPADTRIMQNTSRPPGIRRGL